MRFELAPFAQAGDYAERIVPLEHVKAHCSEDSEDRNDLISFYRDAGVDMVERYVGVALGPFTGREWLAESLPSVVELGVWPVSQITAISWLDSQGTEVNGDPADWRVIHRDRIALKPGRSLPAGVGGGVRITFDGGFAIDACPPVLVQAVKFFAAHLLANREAVGGSITGEIPLGFRSLCNKVRMPRI